MTGQETRNKLTDYSLHLIHEEWTGLTVKKHKDLKGLKSQNLRDHRCEAELIFTALSTQQIAETDEAKGL